MINHDITWEGPLYIQVLTFTDLDVGDLHEHNFNHVSFVPPGSEFDLLLNGKTTRYVGPASIFIERDQNHRFTALKKNSSLCCIHVLRDPKDWDRVLPEGAIPEGSPAWRYIAPLTVKPVK